jgi:signal transduction histidine kinase
MSALNWRRVRRTGVRVQATAIATTVVAGALGGGGLILVLLVHRSLVGSVDSAELARARDVAALATAGRLQSTVASTGEESSVVQVLSPSGVVVAASANITGDAPLLATSPRNRAVQVVTRRGVPIGDQGQSFRVVARPVALPDGPGWIYVATSLAQVDLTTGRLALLLAAGLPVLLLVVGLTTWRAVGRALRPVEQIRSSAASISGAELGARVPVPVTGDEIARLADTMNAMLSRIETAALRQREFVGDASHELRSPLTALQTELDVAIAHDGAELPAALLARLSGQVGRMVELLDGLLLLARADEGVTQRGDETVDLDELVLAEAARLRAAGATVSVVGPDAARVRGSHQDLARVLRNLGDNAVTHARANVTLSVRVEAGQAVMSVADDGPGIAEADRARVFERFTRLDQARSRTATGGGAGLGLAICKQIVDRHGGQISVEGARGARFVVRLPLTGSEKADLPHAASSVLG